MSYLLVSEEELYSVKPIRGALQHHWICARSDEERMILIYVFSFFLSIVIYREY